MAKITKRLVKNLRPDPVREIYVPDDEVKGFGIRLRPSGVGSYVVRHRTADGLSRRLTIGRLGVIEPQEARRIARGYLAAVAAGEHPTLEEREAGEAARELRGGMLHGLDKFRQFKLFAELEESDFEPIARISRIREYETAEKLTTEGAPADCLYLFLKGSVAVKVRGTDGRQMVIDELGPGEILGWAAVTEPHVYTASAWTTRPSQLIVIDGRRLRELCEANKRIGYEVAKGLGEVISRRFSQAVSREEPPAAPRDDLDQLRRFSIFAGLSEGELEAVAEIAQAAEFDGGSELVVEGAPADKLYLVLRGRAKVVVRRPGDQEVVIDELGPGALLGWGAVMEPHVYPATAYTSEPARLIVVDGERLRALCRTNENVGYQVAKGLVDIMSGRFGRALAVREPLPAMSHGVDELRRFSIFHDLEIADLEAIAGIARLQEVPAGQRLMEEGAPADRLYLLLVGKAEVAVAEGEGGRTVIDRLGPGELLGWGAVVEPHVYAASAWTLEPSKVIEIDGEKLRSLCDQNKRLGYQVAKSVGEVMSRRLGRALRGHGVEELHRFKIFEDLDLADLDAIAKIAHVREFATDAQLTREGAPADWLYLFLKGRAEVKVRDPDDRQVPIDEVGPGEVLGWSAVMDPFIYTASAWTVEPSEAIVVSGEPLRELCRENRRLGYRVTRGVSEVISRRFGRVIQAREELFEKGLRAFGGEERVIWDGGEMQVTTEAVLIGMGGDSPEVVPMEIILDVEVEGDRVVFLLRDDRVTSPSLEDPVHVAALVRDQMSRTRHAMRRKDYYLG